MPPVFAALPAIAAGMSAAGAGVGIAQGIDQLSKSGGGGGQVNTSGFDPNSTIRSPEQIKAMQDAAANAHDPANDLANYIQQATLNRIPGASPGSVHEAKRVQEHLARIETAKIRGDAKMLKDATEDLQESMAKLQEQDPRFYKQYSDNAQAWSTKQNGAGAPTTTELLYQEAADKQKQADADADYARNRAYTPTDTTRYDQAYGTQRDQLNADIAKAQADRANDASVQHLQQLAKGEGPAAEAAQAQLRAGLAASNLQAMSQAASARGGAGNRALASRAALMSGAQNSQTAANQGAQMRANMAVQGIQGLAQQRAENMSQDNNLYGMRADSGLKNALFLGDTAQRDASNRIQQYATNDAAFNAARNRGISYYQDKASIPYKNAQMAQSGEQIRTGAANAGAANSLARDKYGTGLILGAAQGATQAADWFSKKWGQGNNDGGSTPAQGQ